MDRAVTRSRVVMPREPVCPRGLHLAEWPAGVGNRIPVLPVPAVRRERRQRWPADIADRIPPVAILTAEWCRCGRLTDVGDRIPPLPVLAIERLRRTGCRDDQRQGGDRRKSGRDKRRAANELSHGISLPHPGRAQTAGWASQRYPSQPGTVSADVPRWYAKNRAVQSRS
jgi:hypothetical protein